MFESRASVLLAFAAASLPALPSCDGNIAAAGTPHAPAPTVSVENAPLITEIDAGTYLIKPDPSASTYSTALETAQAIKAFRSAHPGEWVLVPSDSQHPLSSLEFMAIRRTVPTADDGYSTIDFFTAPGGGK